MLIEFPNINGKWCRSMLPGYLYLFRNNNSEYQVRILRIKNLIELMPYIDQAWLINWYIDYVVDYIWFEIKVELDECLFKIYKYIQERFYFNLPQDCINFINLCEYKIELDKRRVKNELERCVRFKQTIQSHVWWR